MLKTLNTKVSMPFPDYALNAIDRSIDESEEFILRDTVGYS
jgi:hypothetical protein